MSSPENVDPAPTKYEEAEAEAAAAAGPAAAGERDAPFIFDGVSPNLDEREIRGRERGRRRVELGKTVTEKRAKYTRCLDETERKKAVEKVQRLLDIVTTYQVLTRQNTMENGYSDTL